MTSKQFSSAIKGKKKERITKAITILQKVETDAVGYRQNLSLILSIERTVELLKEWRDDIALK